MVLKAFYRAVNVISPDLTLPEETQGPIDDVDLLKGGLTRYPGLR
jgi:hypothetical protein